MEENSEMNTESILNQLDGNEKKLVLKLVEMQDTYELPGTEDLKMLSVNNKFPSIFNFYFFFFKLLKLDYCNVYP